MPPASGASNSGVSAPSPSAAGAGAYAPRPSADSARVAPLASRVPPIAASVFRCGARQHRQRRSARSGGGVARGGRCAGG
eukprot:160041-Chlamydomonas_euryale.AAC.1